MEKESNITYTVGVDLGGTNTALAIVDSEGNIIARDIFLTNGSEEEWCDRLASGIRSLISNIDKNDRDKILGVGIGAPCANTASGCLEGATNLTWASPMPLQTLMETRLGLPVTIANDANAAAIGEMTYGRAKGMKNFIVLTLGTGVGSAVVCDGHLLNGARGFAGELGHVTFPFAADRLCGCGRYGCLETVAAARGVVETAKRFLEKSDAPSPLRVMGDDMTSRDVAIAAEAGDEIARSVFEFTGECLGKAAAEFAAFSDPEAIILFGGVARSGHLMTLAMHRAFKKCALHLYRDRVKFLLSGIKDTDAAILGAAALPYLLSNRT